MGKYDFDEIIDRRGTASVKWDLYGGDVLPMWVADMDFKAAPAILQALQKRLDHGVFGYPLLGRRFYKAITDWFKERHGWTIRKEDLIPTTGVIAAYSACIKAVTKPGEKVIIMPPVYNCFFPAVRNNRCVESRNALVYKDGRYSIDFDDLERRAAEPDATALLLCNPHNPAGRVWTREELLRIGEICLRHDVFVISDEIHCELTYPGHDYTPFGSLPEEISLNSASCISPTKAFNIAGIQIAAIAAPDAQRKAAIDRAINENECCDVNVFGVAALEAAYREGGDWLDELRVYLKGNADCVRGFFEEKLPGFPVLPLEGTYLMWIDCRKALRPGEPSEGFSERLATELREGHGLAVCPGTLYGQEGEGFIRLNIACPRALVEQGLEKLRLCLANR